MTTFRLLIAAFLLVGLVPAAAMALEYDAPPEDYASYEPQKRCARAVQPGTRQVAAWIDVQFGGGRPLAGLRSCRSGGTSEHKDGRAIDWSMDANRRGHRYEVGRFLDRIFAADPQDNAHALARRMGIMYVIWNDRMWASYDGFRGKPYKSSSCKRLARCSATLRHRDHVHISLSKRGAAALTSWYVARAAR